MTPRGALTVLYDFSGADGFEVVAGLFRGQDGDFCGTMVLGGTSSVGPVFKITSAGAFTNLE
jgi:hypothetical protein